MDELKPCPFCGGKAKLIRSYFTWVKCEECEAESAAFDTLEFAIDAWNRRNEK